MSNQLVPHENRGLTQHKEFDEKQLQLLKDTYCKGATNEEFSLFCMVCKHTGLDPFLKQIHPVKRWNTKLGREEMTCQTSIDGYRLIAERTGKYCPGRESTFTYTPEGHLLSATSYVKKQTADGSWHEVSATAFYAEYVQTTKEGKPTQFWARMPHVMLAKCAEALALKKCFPAQLSGIYTSEEMGQADNPRIGKPASNALNIEYGAVELLDDSILEVSPTGDTISMEQKTLLQEMIGKNKTRLNDLLKHYEIMDLEQLPAMYFEEAFNILKQKKEEK